MLARALSCAQLVFTRLKELVRPLGRRLHIVNRCGLDFRAAFSISALKVLIELIPSRRYLSLASLNTPRHRSR